MMPNPVAYRASASVARSQSRTLQRRVEPLTTVDPVDATVKGTTRVCRCGKCEKGFLATAVIDKPVDFDAKRKIHVITRQLYCDHCDHIQVWTEQATFDLTSQQYRPSGQVEVGPIYKTDTHDIARFLKRHPEARGVNDNG